ncbi:CD4-1 molecule [Aplochiton taeniatus]
MLAGDTLTLTCNVQQSAASPQISWLHPQKKTLAQDPRVQGASGSQLTVRNVSGQDSGEWVCVLTYKGRETHARTTVTIVVSQPSLGIPCVFTSQFSWKDLRKMEIQGGSWTFTSLRQAVPKKLYSLSTDDPPAWMEVQSAGLLVSALQPDGPRDLSLSRSRVTMADRGQYTCAMDFHKVTLKSIVLVEVLQILSSPSSELLIGQQINLTCSLGHALPSGISVKWIPPGESSSRTPSLGPPPHSDLLILQEALGRHRGSWRCELWRNTSLLTWANITLKIERAPMGVWLLVTICAAAFIFLILLFLTVILIRRHKQRRTMPMCHKKRFCRCKDPKPKGFYRT